MREILYRGKRISNGEWVEGYYIKATNHWHEHGVHNDWIACISFQNGGMFNVVGRYPVKLETVGMFTGVLDKNCVKIYEGDIFKAKTLDTNEVRFFEVVFGEYKDDSGETHVGLFARCGSGIVAFGQVKEYWQYIEVVGNVYDNKELLESNK